MPLDANLDVGLWIRDYCWKKGMILRNNGDILVIAPALVMTGEETDFMLDLIDAGLSAAARHFGLS